MKNPEIPVFAFAGKHLIASYIDCDFKRLTDLETLVAQMKHAVDASGATLLNYSQHIFEGNGITAVMLLSESHASIHTYPEHRACFIDIFTCGDHCHPQVFNAVLKDYLKPAQVSEKLLVRDGSVEAMDQHSALSPNAAISVVSFA